MSEELKYQNNIIETVDKIILSLTLEEISNDKIEENIKILNNILGKNKHPIIANYLQVALENIKKRNFSIAIPCLSLLLSYYDD